MAGLNQFIFGNAIAIQESDLYIYGGLAVFIILCLTIFQKEFSLLVSIQDYGRAIGFRWE